MVGTTLYCKGLIGYISKSDPGNPLYIHDDYWQSGLGGSSDFTTGGILNNVDVTNTNIVLTMLTPTTGKYRHNWQYKYDILQLYRRWEQRFELYHSRSAGFTISSMDNHRRRQQRISLSSALLSKCFIDFSFLRYSWEGTSVTISGRWLTNATAVKFGTTRRMVPLRSCLIHKLKRQLREESPEQ